MAAQTMFAPLSTEEQEVASEAKPASSSTKTPIIPVPDDAPPSAFRHPKYGKPTGQWDWHDADGKLVAHTLRFDFEKDGKPDKEVLPLTYCEIKEGNRTTHGWRSRGVPAPRPLYRLPLLLASPNKPVIITEGEKKADRAAELFPDFESTTTMGGAAQPQLTDLAALAGREVVIWPDHDDAGKRYAEKVAKLALAAGASKVAIVQVQENFPPKWDVADELPPGVTVDDLLRLLTEAVEVESFVEGPAVEFPAGYSMAKRGLVWGDPFEEEDEEKKEFLLACRFEVLAETRDSDGRSWGVLLHWVDHDGRDHEVALPRAMLAGDGAEARRLLIDGGLFVAPGRKPRELLNAFLMSVRASGRARATNRVGWYNDAFVFPDGTCGSTGDERLLLQDATATEHAFNVNGSLKDWNEKVARFALGNSRLVLAVSTAFAATLVGPCAAESGGLHFKGASSIGKTTLLQVAGSVWGGGEPGGYVRSWRATANGLEGVALAHCDALLCLDEMSQLPAKEAGEVAYMLANCAGKSRAARDGGTRRAAQWRVLFLSSGEVGLADKVAESGTRRRLTAGQQVRIVDVPADAGAGLGIFETLNGFATADLLARHLRAAARANYGTPIRAFLNAIAGDLDRVRDGVARHVTAFDAAHVPDGADGQVLRVAQRFGLIAAAGELAVTAGAITEWKEGDATVGAARCFRDWLAARGGVEPSEVRDGIDQVRAFILANGEARFVPAWEDGNGDRRVPLRDIAGYRKRSEDGWEYFVTATAWRDEVCRGFDSRALAAAMVARDLMEPGNGDHRAKLINVPELGRVRLYHLPPRFLENEKRD
jgi:putative DNA primase/helicase